MLVEARSAGHWARELTALWDDPERRRRLGASARDWVVSTHTWEAAASVAAAGLEFPDGRRNGPAPERADPGSGGLGMKQVLFMVTLTLLGTVGCLVRPFYGVAVYYLFAVLRPQFLWQWSLPPGIQWSRFVGAGVARGGPGLRGRVPTERCGGAKGRGPGRYTPCSS